MTLMPVSNIARWRLERVERRRRRGGSPSARCRRSSEASTSSGSPHTFQTWPSTSSPTGTVMPRPGVAHRRAAGEAVGRLQADGPHPALAELLGDLGQRRRRSRRRRRSSNSSARVDLGQRAAGELDVDHRAGDARRPGRPSARVGAFSVMVMTAGSYGEGRSRSSRRRGRTAVLVGLVGLPSASAPPTISMISVVIESWRARFMIRLRRLDQLLGVVGGRLHRPLAEGVLGGRGVEQGGVDAGLDVAGQQRVEDRRRGRARTRSRPSAAVASAPAWPSPPSTVSRSSGTSGRSTTSWMPAEMNRV